MAPRAYFYTLPPDHPNHPSNSLYEKNIVRRAAAPRPLITTDTVIDAVTPAFPRVFMELLSKIKTYESRDAFVARSAANVSMIIGRGENTKMWISNAARKGFGVEHIVKVFEETMTEEVEDKMTRRLQGMWVEREEIRRTFAAGVKELVRFVVGEVERGEFVAEGSGIGSRIARAMLGSMNGNGNGSGRRRGRNIGPEIHWAMSVPRETAERDETFAISYARPTRGANNVVPPQLR